MGRARARNMSSTTGYSATPTADFSVIEISERKATDPAYYWKVSTAFLGVVAVALMFIAVEGHSTETVDATPDGNARATDLMWGRPSSAKCEGAGKLPGGGPLCYQVKVGMFGVTETIDMKIAGSTESAGSAEETGKMDLTGSGISPFKCSGVDITKNGQTCNPDADQLKHCLPRGITLESADYCSNTDQVQITIKDSNIPSPAITATASRVKCDSSPAEATDLMWGFPGSSTSKLRQGTTLKPGLQENSMRCPRSRLVGITTQLVDHLTEMPMYKSIGLTGRSIFRMHTSIHGSKIVGIVKVTCKGVAMVIGTNG